MNCDDCQSRICELLDPGQSARHDPAVELHLADCPACREFRDTWAALDAQLTRQVVAAALPADFKTTLLARLPAPQPRLTPAEIATRREQLEREYRDAVTALKRRHLFPNPVMIPRLLAVAGTCALAGVVLPEATRVLPAAVEVALGPAGVAQAMPLLGLVIGMAAALYGLRRLLRRQTRWLLALPG